MGTWQIKKICLSCKHYRLTDEMSGLCRVDKKNAKNYPMKLHDDTCRQWKDCGQQYYIRTGWIKSKKNQSNDSNKGTKKH